VLQSVIADAYEFVNSQGSKKTKFDILYMDINYEESNMQLSPPFKFLETSFLQALLVSLAFINLLEHDYQ
jgi:hypothetical protein